MSSFPYRPTVAGLCVALLVSVMPAGADKPAKALPDLSGTWQINEDLSQMSQQAMRQRSESAPSEGRGGGPGRRGGGGFPGGGGGRRRGGGGEGFPGGGPPADGRPDFETAEGTMTNEITNDGRRLFILIGLDGRGPRPMQFRRVYDRAAEEEKAPESTSPPAPLPSPALPAPGEGGNSDNHSTNQPPLLVSS